MRSLGGPSGGTAPRTRRRILGAALQEWERVGPARTAVSAVAQVAGVQRLTVYRHFPDRDDLIVACVAALPELRPPPDPQTWTRFADPDERLRMALGDLYAYFAANERLIANVRRDVEELPEAAARAVEDADRRVERVLLEGRGGRAVRGRRVAAALGLATAFETWRLLVRRRGLEPERAVDLMVSFVARA